MNNKIFISGKITGDPNYALKFESACIVVSREGFFDRYGSPDLCYRHGHFGFVPVDPCEMTILGVPLQGWPWWMCMARTLCALTFCSYVYVLRDWKDSRGARAEHRWAKLLHKHIIYQIK